MAYQAKRSVRAANHLEFAKYMAAHGIPIVVDQLVSKLAETQPRNPLQQMHDMLGEMLAMELEEAGPGEAANDAYRLYLRGSFADGTGQTRPFRMHVACVASSFSALEAQRWASAVDTEIRQLLSGPPEQLEGRHSGNLGTMGTSDIVANSDSDEQRIGAQLSTRRADLHGEGEADEAADGASNAAIRGAEQRQAGSVASGDEESETPAPQARGHVPCESGVNARADAAVRESKLSLAEVQEEVRKAGMDISEEPLAELFAEVDEDGDGLVTMEEVEAGMRARPAVGSVEGVASFLGSKRVGVMKAVAERVLRCLAARTGATVEAVDMMGVLREVDAEEDVRRGWREAEEVVVVAFAKELETLRGTADGAMTGEAFNAKFAAEGGTFEGKYKEIGAFWAGVEGALGLPGKNIIDGMEMEFCHAADSADEFKTSNYGGNITTPKKEWEFVVQPQAGDAHGGGRVPIPLRVFLLAASAVKASSGEEVTTRYDTELEALEAEERSAVKMVLLRRVKEVGMSARAVEAAAAGDARLQALAKSSEGRLRRVQRELGRVLRERDGPRSQGMGQYEEVAKEAQRRCGLTEEELEALVASARRRLGRARLLEEEVVALRLYTGPCFMKLNGTLRERDVGQKGNDYVCTIFAAISGMAKLAEATPIPEDRVVYRGQKGMRLPEAFWKGNDDGVKGGVEAAFLSTTTEMEVAAGYASSGALPTVFSIAVGAIDKGAALSFLSQYPNEDEILMPPRSFLEVVGEPSVQPTSVGPVLSIPVKINCNLQSPTLEKLRESRKTMLVSTLRHVQKEVVRDVDAALGSAELKKRAEADIFWDRDDEGGGGKRFVASIKEEAQKALKGAEERAAGWFNDDANFRREMQEALDMARRSLGKLRLWMEDTTQYVSGLNDLSGRECDRRAAGRMQRQMDEAGETMGDAEEVSGREQRQAAARKLCRHQELMDAEVDEVLETSHGENSMMMRAANGDESGVGLLLAARANVEASRSDGVTALMLAAERGSVGVVRRLAGDGGANPDAEDAYGFTALTYAARNGHAEVTRVLVEEFGSNMQTQGQLPRRLAAYDGHLRALQVLWKADKMHSNAANPGDAAQAVSAAAQNGHEGVVKWLVEVAGADTQAREIDGTTAVMMAASNGHEGVVKWLVEVGGADAQARTNDGTTSVMWAARKAMRVW